MNLKDLYIDFFLSKDHKQIPSSPVIPENDPTCLFNTAGMQPLIPYLLGQTHPYGTRLVDYQKCIRTNDLESVGDTTHHTFFEMLGNWSLGDYFKKESISWSFEFLTKVLELPVERLAVTVFKGNDLIPEDTESIEIWKSLGIKDARIAKTTEDNFWIAGETGPCGPDTEIFYFRSDDEIPDVFDPEDDRWVEIWNNVFMQFNKKIDGSIEELPKKNVDTGMGFERVTAILEGVNDNYTTSIWKDVIEKIEELSGKIYKEIVDNRDVVLEVLRLEKIKFNRTLEKGLREFEKIIIQTDNGILNKDLAFKLYDTYGFPIELTIELAEDAGVKVDVLGFDEKFKEHQEKSRAGSSQKFKGGLSSTSDMNIKYHTATHLLNAALKLVINNDVHQKGSNITDERMRFDFSCDHKLTAEEIEKTEIIINNWIKEDLPVNKTEMTKEEAVAMGAECMFIEKYPDIVTVYTVGNVSKEICGGPHVTSTSELGVFKITKEEASSAGVRRIKATLSEPIDLEVEE